MNETTPPARPGRTARAGMAQSQTMQALRGLCHLIAVVVITLWALLEWPLPWPGILAGAGFLVASVLLWALFLSPRPVLHTDRFGQGLVELLFIAGAIGAMLGLGVPWVVAALFGLAAAALGYVAGSRRG